MHAQPAHIPVLPRSGWSHPQILLAGVAAIILIGLLLRPFLPIGPSYWDLSIYLDGAHRIANGQVPNRDFLTPAGPLEYYLFYLINRLFPEAHPLLSTHWCIALVALPIFALIVPSLDRQSRAGALALTLPFALFLLLPLNTTAGYPAPGFDGYGIYNRHPALLLYLLVAALLFVERRVLLQVVIGLLMLSLFLTKITGFVTGVLLVGYACLSGRIRILDTIVTALACLAMLGVIEMTSGMTSAYVANMLQLAALNESSFLRRYRAFFGSHLEVYLPLGFAIAAILIGQGRELFARGVSLLARGREFLNSHALWLGAALAASFVFEIQNTGSQEFIYLWPIMLLIARDTWHGENRFCIAILAALAVVAVPMFVNFAQRGVQTVISSISYQRLDARELGPIGRINARPGYFLRAAAMTRHYIDQRAAYRALAKQGVTHSDLLTSEPDFQIGWLTTTAVAAGAFEAFEINTGRRFESVYTFDFTDPFPFLLGKRPVRFVQIGLDAQRTLPPRDERMMQSIASADAILVPYCPAMPMREAIAQRFATATEGRQRIALTPCFDLLIRNGSDFAARQ